MWIALQNPCRHMECELKKFHLSPEEVFFECITVLDDIKENPKYAKTTIEGLADQVFIDFREIDTSCTDSKELKLATCVVLYSLLSLLNETQTGYYTRLCLSLTDNIRKEGDDVYNHLAEIFNTHIFTTFQDDALSLYISNYMNDSELWLSDEIGDLLKTVPKMVVESNKEIPEGDTDDKTEQLTNRQLILLFEVILNIPLTPEFTNQKALAKLLSKVSGRSAEAIRQKIMQGVNYDEPSVKKDVKALVSLIKPLSPRFAEIMENNIE